MRNKIKDLFDARKYRRRCNTYKISFQTLLKEYTEVESENKELREKIRKLKKELKELKKVIV